MTILALTVSPLRPPIIFSHNHPNSGRRGRDRGRRGGGARRDGRGRRGDTQMKRETKGEGGEGNNTDDGLDAGEQRTAQRGAVCISAADASSPAAVMTA